MLPLQDLNILDLTRLIPGGYATLILADLGAEVLKIEDIELGDYSRWMEPTIGEYGVYFHALNRNKKSMKLNLKAEDGKKIFKKLVEKGYDTIVESFRPGVMDRLGIGYNTLREINPRVIYCAISGYGQNGPKKDKALHDLNCLAVSGALSITGEGTPAIPGIQIADTSSALFSVISILTAYITRGKTSQGQFLDVSMTDGLISLLSIHLIKFLVDSKIPEGGKMDFNGKFPCYRIYKTKDGEYMTLAALEKKFWENFCNAIGRRDLIDKQHDDSIDTRNKIENIFKSKTRIEWEEISENIDSCLEPVLNFKEVTRHPHLKSRELFFDIESQGANVPQVRIPFLMSDVNNTPRNPAPLWGEHTDEILISVGYDEKEIKSLKKRGVIG